MSEKLERILYTEDDLDIAEIAMMTLEDLGGFKVVHCHSGQATLDALPSYQPQLLLMDVMMPHMDGPETLRNIRKTAEGKNIPIIFMTAKAQTHEQQAYLKMGAIGVIVKPFDPLKLCDTINELWQKHRAESASH